MIDVLEKYDLIKAFSLCELNNMQCKYLTIK